ncbi:ABC transporter ATP-binding protein [Pelagibius sp.]|uniref:ABC transporter ATP-binding protein n=1 Tax=Pelagibius sp. TaxID=1931238 RepID=UPI00261D5320|nr:ABC transporter ATP-binding protein [Pelagibius sp.]
MVALTISSVSKRFGEIRAVEAVSLDVADGEFLAVLGPSGCGKTTLLRLIAGFERLDAGSIHLGDLLASSDAHHLATEDRRIGIVFQSYALWPHMSVAGNVGYPLRVQRVRGSDYDRRVAAALETVGLKGLEERRPAELSGGQRQRVALARCLVMEPRIVLLDEPLANLDVHLRAAMEEEFAAFHAKTGATMVYITHDQAEAMTLADRIAVMHDGRLAQLAAPRDLYRKPQNDMVADFIGQGSIVPAEVSSLLREGRCTATLLGRDFVLRCAPDQRQGPARVCLRPEDLVLSPEGAIRGRALRVTYKGGVTAVEVAPEADPAARLQLTLPDDSAPSRGDPVRLTVQDGWVIPAA